MKIASRHLEAIKFKIDKYFSSHSNEVTKTCPQINSTPNLQLISSNSKPNTVHESSSVGPKGILPSFHVQVQVQGFSNIGNNCYLNSLLQCILSVSDVILEELKKETNCTDTKNSNLLLGFEWNPNKKRTASSLASLFIEFISSKNQNLKSCIFSLQVIENIFVIYRLQYGKGGRIWAVDPNKMHTKFLYVYWMVFMKTFLIKDIQRNQESHFRNFVFLHSMELKVLNL